MFHEMCANCVVCLLQDMTLIDEPLPLKDIIRYLLLSVPCFVVLYLLVTVAFWVSA